MPPFLLQLANLLADRFAHAGWPWKVAAAVAFAIAFAINAALR